MTLAQQIVADVTGVFLNTADFAEQVTYYFAAGGAPLVVNAIVDPRIDPQEEEFVKRDVEVIDVAIAMDPAGLAGLPRPPAHGDYLQRTGNGDLPTIAYAFLGRIEASVGGMYEAVFQRQSLRQTGITK